MERPLPFAQVNRVSIVEITAQQAQKIRTLCEGTNLNVDEMSQKILDGILPELLIHKKTRVKS